MKDRIHQTEIKASSFNYFFGFFWLFALVSAVLQPFKNDCLVFWAWAQKVYDSPLTGLDAFESVWDIKGILSRLIYYHLYAFTRLFTSDLYPYGYIVFKLLGFIEINLFLALSTWLVPDRYLSGRKTKLNLFFFLSLAVSTLNRMCNLQPEVWGFAFLLLSFILYLRGKWWEKLLGGLVLGLVFFLKTPLLLLSGSVFFAALLVEDRNFVEGIKTILLYAISAMVTVVLLLVWMNWACPQEIQDIADAAYFQPTLVHYGPLKMLRYLGYGVAKFWEMPLNLPILCLGGVSFMLFITNKKLNECLYMMGMWLFPYLYVAVSNCYFIYHFVVFVFAAVLTFYLTKDYWKQIMTKQLFVGLWIVFLAGLVCTFEPIFDISIRIRNMLFLVPYVVMTFALVEKWRTKVLSIGVLFLVFTFIATISAFSYPQMGAKKMDKMTNEKNEKKGYRMGMKLGEDCVLQLNAGLGSLWFSNLSYLRYLYPLILEGRNESSHIKQSSFFVETKEKIIDYQGEYIVTDWEYSKKMDDGIQAFIEEHYYTSDTLYYYGFYYDLYDYKEKTFEFYILKRKGIDYNNEPVITE
jgi:hypothetical protein